MENSMKFFFEVYGELSRAGPGDNTSTRKAYSMMKDLPEHPKILDIGCGPGMQTIELAKLSKGQIIALDNHQPFLDKVERSAKKLGLSQSIQTTNQDMNEMKFDPKTFDIIWAEGALYIMGFENGLKRCREFLKDKGYIAASELVWLKPNPPQAALDFAKEYEAMKNIPDNLDLFKNNGYEMIGHFTLPVSSWLDDYYNPMQKRIFELQKKYKDNKTAIEVIDSAQLEIDLFKKSSDFCGYEFFVARNA